MDGPGYIDVFGQLAPQLQRLLALGVARGGVSRDQLLATVTEPAGAAFAGATTLKADFVLRLATGQVLRPDLGLDAVPAPLRELLEQRTLRQRPGILFIDRVVSRFVGGVLQRRAVPIPLHRQLLLFGGQTLLGVAAVSGGEHAPGTVLEWQGQEDAALRMVGTRGAVEAVVLTRHVHGRDLLGISIESERARIERAGVTGFGWGIAVRADSAALFLSRVHATERAFVVEGMASRAKGCHFSCAGGERGPVVTLVGSDNALVRCRIDAIAEEGAGGVAAPVLAVSGRRNLITGCRLVGDGGAAPLVSISRPEAIENVFERNVYSGPTGDVGMERSPDAPPLVDRPALIHDAGRRTLFRDTARAGFRGIDFSTASYLLNGSFEDVVRVTYPIPRRGDELADLPEPDVHEQDRAPEGPGAPPGRFDDEGLRGRWVPLRETLRPAGWDAVESANWADRAQWELLPPPPGAPPENTHFLDFGSPPDVPYFVEEGAGPAERIPPDGGPFDWFGRTSNVHHGRRSLWLGVYPQAGRPLTTASVQQRVELPRVAESFLFSAYVKAQPGQGGDALLRVLDDRGVLRGLGRYQGNGDWSLVTVRVDVPPGTGPYAVRVQCVITATRQAMQAYFDRAMLVAGTMVPQYVERALTDDGADVAGLTVELVQSGEVVLKAADPRVAGLDRIVDLEVVGQPLELTQDLLVALAEGHGKAVGAQGVWLDVRLNDRSMFRQGAVPVCCAGEVATLPLSHLRDDCRRLAVGDVVSLRASPAAVSAGATVVLSGQRWSH